MSKKLTIAILFFLIVFFNRCSTINKRALQKNITQLLEQHGMIGVKVKCDMSNLSRSGKCLLTQSSESFEILIKELNLKDIESLAQDFEAELEKRLQTNKTNFESKKEPRFRGNGDYYRYWENYKMNRTANYEDTYTCDSIETFRDLNSMKIYGNLDSSSRILLEGGGAFAKFILFHRLDTNEACIQVTYAYG